MIDAALATQLAVLLAPFLPKLMDTAAAAGKNAIDTLAGKAGESAWKKAFSVWNILRPEFEKEPGVAKVIRDVAGNPNDPRTEALLSWQLEKLALPPTTLAEIQKIIATSKDGIRIIAASSGGVAIGGNISSSIIVTGSYNNRSKQ